MWRHVTTALVLAVLLALLVGVFWSMYRVWVHFDTQMSVHGWIALVLGVVFSLIVGEHFWGAPGALLAVPCMSIAQSLFLHFLERTDSSA